MLGALAGFALKGKLGAGIVAGTALASFLAGGFVLNEFWLGKNARAENTRLESAMTAKDEELLKARRNLNIERDLKEAALTDAQDLRLKLEDRENRLEESYDLTANVLARVPKDTIRIMEEGNDVGDKLAQNEDTAWVRYTWPTELYDVAWRDRSAD